jgi:hypothetical protein
MTLMHAPRVLGALALSFLASPALAAPWVELYEDDGIKVWRQAVQGSDLVAFRGVGVVAAPILQVAAVLRDADREEEWMDSCEEAFVVKQLPNVVDARLYHRSASPVFVISDRDFVLETRTSIDAAAKMVLVEFSTVDDPEVPPRDGAVRMPSLVGHWKLWQRDAQSTLVEYQVHGDPGGSLPTWLVNLVQKKHPHKTLLGLRKQVARGGYEAHRKVLEARLDWSPFTTARPVAELRAAPARTSTAAH